MTDLVDPLSSLAPYPGAGLTLVEAPYVTIGAVYSVVQATAYGAIAGALGYFYLRREDLQVRVQVALLVALFALNALYELLALTAPTSVYLVALQTTTAAVAIACALSIWPSVFRLIGMTNPQVLAEDNELLAIEVENRKRAEQDLSRVRDELEYRVVQRTRELGNANTKLELEIAERRRAEADLRLTLNRLHRLVTNTPLAVIEIEQEIEVDKLWLIRTWSGQASAIFGYLRSEVVGRSLEEIGIFDQEAADRLGPVLEGRCDEELTRRPLHAQLFTKHGEVRHCALHISVVESTGEDVSGIVMMLIEDVTEGVMAKRHVEYLAHHDTLTGLPNRLLFNDRVGQAMEAAKRRGSKVAVLLVDVDRFKEVNDQYGHAAGDELLRDIAHRLREALRAQDTAARLGGDEFAIVQIGINDVRDATVLARRLLDTLSQPFSFENHAPDISISIGIAVFPEHGSAIDILLRRADVALYQAKRSGRAGFVIYDSELGNTVHTPS